MLVERGLKTYVADLLFRVQSMPLHAPSTEPTAEQDQHNTTPVHKVTECEEGYNLESTMSYVYLQISLDDGLNWAYCSRFPGITLSGLRVTHRWASMWY